MQRRNLLQSISAGFGYLAFTGISTQAAIRDRNPLALKQPHHPARAKRIIFACMRGGPSHVDTFDYKPALKKDQGKSHEGRKWMPSISPFRPRGTSGLPISDLFPNVAKHADDLCLLNGMYSDIPAHPQAFVQLHTGSAQFVRPSMGAWIQYGLGVENENVPGFITIKPPTRVGGAQNYGAAFLPAMYQGTAIGAFGQSLKDASIPNLKSRRGDLQRKQLDLVQGMNRDLLERKQVNPELEGVIESYELAFRMQSAGRAQHRRRTRARQKTLRHRPRPHRRLRAPVPARPPLRRGRRTLHRSHPCQLGPARRAESQTHRQLRRPLGGLLTDLKQRGMLEDTIVMWGGEFGRTPHVKKADGRDHNNKGFTFWLAGGGFKGGIRHGATDPHGQKAVEGKVHFHDLHATLLHQLGLDHEKPRFPPHRRVRQRRS